MIIPKTSINTIKKQKIITISGDCGDVFKKHIILAKKDEALNWLLMLEKTAPKTVEIEVTLAGRGARASIAFAWNGTKTMKSDIILTISHTAPKTESRVAFGATLEGASIVSFRGLVRIGKMAKGSKAHLSARGLMLSEKSLAFLKPDLEVETSDAIAGHGSSLGRPSDKEMFYFASRGIAQSATYKIIKDAFIKEITNSL